MVRTHYESADYDTGNALLLNVGIHINVNTYMYNYFLISLVAKQLTIRKLYSKSFKSGLIRVSYWVRMIGHGDDNKRKHSRLVSAKHMKVFPSLSFCCCRCCCSPCSLSLNRRPWLGCLRSLLLLMMDDSTRYFYIHIAECCCTHWRLFLLFLFVCWKNAWLTWMECSITGLVRALIALSRIEPQKQEQRHTTPLTSNYYFYYKQLRMLCLFRSFFLSFCHNHHKRNKTKQNKKDTKTKEPWRHFRFKGVISIAFALTFIHSFDDVDGFTHYYTLLTIHAYYCGYDAKTIVVSLRHQIPHRCRRSKRGDNELLLLSYGKTSHVISSRRGASRFSQAAIKYSYKNSTTII